MSKIYHKNAPKKSVRSLPPPPGKSLKNNDNPVPPIDLQKLKDFINIYESKPGVARFITSDFVRSFENHLKQVKLSGVENDKEQPNNFFEETELDY